MQQRKRVDKICIVQAFINQRNKKIRSENCFTQFKKTEQYCQTTQVEHLARHQNN